MAFKLGKDWSLVYDASNNWNSPSWTVVTSAIALGFNRNLADVEYPLWNEDTGHSAGLADPVITATILDSSTDTAGQAIINAHFAGTQIHLGITRGAVATSGTKIYHMQCVILGGEPSLERNAPAGWQFEAKRDVNGNSMAVITV